METDVAGRMGGMFAESWWSGSAGRRGALETEAWIQVCISAFQELGPQTNWAFTNWASEPQTQTVASDMGNILVKSRDSSKEEVLDKEAGPGGKGMGDGTNGLLCLNVRFSFWMWQKSIQRFGVGEWCGMIYVFKRFHLQQYVWIWQLHCTGKKITVAKDKCWIPSFKVGTTLLCSQKSGCWLLWRIAGVWQEPEEVWGPRSRFSFFVWKPIVRGVPFVKLHQAGGLFYVYSFCIIC